MFNKNFRFGIGHGTIKKEFKISLINIGPIFCFYLYKFIIIITNMFEIAHYAKPILQELISRVLLEIETRGRVFV